MVDLPSFDIQPTLVGDKVMLRPLRDDDFEALYAVAADPEIWAMHPYRDRYKREIFEGFFADAMASKGAFAIFDQADGKMIGSTRFANYDMASGEIEIGWTFFACSHWRGGHNREVKALMLSYIFSHVGTVVFQVGASNFRSRTAVERLGARLAREYVREYQGQMQDYVMYRLTAADAKSGALALETDMNGESKLERRFWRFWLGGLLILAVMIAMNPWFTNPVSPWGIRDHQSAGTAIRVDAIQAAWEAAGVMNLARLGIAIDLIYIGIYSFGAYCGGRLFAQSPQPSLRRLGWIIVAAAVTVGVADYLETVCQFVQAMSFRGSDLLARVAATAQPIKSLAFLTSFFGLLAALFLRRMARRNA